MGCDAGEGVFACDVAYDGDDVVWREFGGLVEFVLTAADDVDFFGAVKGKCFCHHETDPWQLWSVSCSCRVVVVANCLPVAPPVITTTIPFTLNNSPGVGLDMLKSTVAWYCYYIDLVW